MSLKKLILSLVICLVICIPALNADQKLRGKAKTNFRSANMYYGQENLEKAIPLYQEVIKEKPDHIDSNHKLGDIFYNKAQDSGKPEKFFDALVYYDAAIKALQDPENHEKRSSKRQKQITREDDLKKFVQSCAINIFNGGLKLVKEEKYDEAITLLERLVTAVPDFSKTYTLLGNAYMSIGKTDKAIEVLVKSYEVASAEDKEPIANTIAGTYAQAGNYEEAVKWYQKSVESVENANAYFNIGICYQNLKDPDKAAVSFEKSIELDPKNTDAMHAAGTIYYGKKDFAKAAKFYKMIVDLNETKESLQNLCYAYNSAEMYEELLPYAIKLYELDKTQKDPLYLIIQSVDKNHLNKPDLHSKYMKILQGMQ